MQGQADQNPPTLTWKKLTVQVFKWNKNTRLLTDRSKIKNRSACCPECGARVRAHRGVPPLKRHVGGQILRCVLRLQAVLLYQK